jgi:6-phosphogluconolactonase/glucosamine-6-phosphate isomerase/deaminase
MFFEGERKREAFNKILDVNTPINLAPAKFIYNLPQTTTFSDLVA